MSARMLGAGGAGGIPGDPEALRLAARGIEAAAREAEDILENIRLARTGVLAGWSAPSAHGFESFTTEAMSRAPSWTPWSGSRASP